MATQTAVATTIAFAPETNFGEVGAGPGQLIRRVSSSLNIQKDSFASNEILPDYQIASFRHGGQRAGGQIEGELSTESYDAWFEALLRGTWATGASISDTGHTSVAASGSVFTFGSGSLITAGFKLGDTVRFSQLTSGAASNNAKNFRIVGLTATTMTVFPAPTAHSAQNAFTCAVAGKKLLMGTERRSFSIEQRYSDIDTSELLLGCRIGGASISVPANGISRISWEIQGREGTLLSEGASPQYVSPNAPTITDVLTGIEGGLRIAGADSAVISQADLQINLNAQAGPVIGDPRGRSIDIWEGGPVVTGSIAFYLANAALLRAFLNEEEIDLHMTLPAAGAEPRAFLSFIMPRIKLTAAQKQVPTSGGIIVQASLQALAPITAGAGTAFDKSTLTIQRSNA